MEIKHIPRKKNPADSLSHQLVADALVRKGSVKDANAEYVKKLLEVQSQLQIKRYKMHFINYSIQALKANAALKTIRPLKANQF